MAHTRDTLCLLDLDGSSSLVEPRSTLVHEFLFFSGFSLSRLVPYTVRYQKLKRNAVNNAHRTRGGGGRSR